MEGWRERRGQLKKWRGRQRGQGGGETRGEVIMHIGKERGGRRRAQHGGNGAELGEARGWKMVRIGHVERERRRAERDERWGRGGKIKREGEEVWMSSGREREPEWGNIHHYCGGCGWFCKPQLQLHTPPPHHIPMAGLNHTLTHTDAHILLAIHQLLTHCK